MFSARLFQRYFRYPYTLIWLYQYFVSTHVRLMSPTNASTGNSVCPSVRKGVRIGVVEEGKEKGGRG